MVLSLAATKINGAPTGGLLDATVQDNSYSPSHGGMLSDLVSDRTKVGKNIAQDEDPTEFVDDILRVQDVIRTGASGNVTNTYTTTTRPTEVPHHSKWRLQESCVVKRKSFVISSPGCVSKTVTLGMCAGKCYTRPKVSALIGNVLPMSVKHRCCRSRETDDLVVTLTCNAGSEQKHINVKSATACQCSSKHRS